MARVLIGNVKPVKGIDYLTAEDIEELKKLFAPAGYGIGEDIKQYVTMSDLDNTYVNGLYWVTSIGSVVDGETFNYALARVSGSGTTHSIQELFPLGLDKVLIRRCYEGVWDTEWDQLVWKSKADNSYAPAGYGLGIPSNYAKHPENINTVFRSGYYLLTMGNANTSVEILHALARTESECVQERFSTSDNSYRRRCTLRGSDGWSEWEWANPPMLLGVEYRTTERWQGKAVYTKAVNCGALPNSASVIVPHECAAIAVIRSCGVTNLGTTIPYRWNDNYLSVSADRTNIHLCTNTDFSGQTCIVQLWYTKE